MTDRTRAEELKRKACDYCGVSYDEGVAMYFGSDGSSATCVGCVLVADRIFVNWGLLPEELEVYHDKHGRPLNDSKR